MISEQFEQKAIQLITVNEHGKYVLHPEGEQFISKVQKPIAVVSVAGMYRTGKSYLLNRMLLNRSNGFGVGPTINPCTKGLWCWGTPIKGTSSNGQKINVIIIDTEGIGALDQDQNHDTKIFTLAVLSASTFIYNSVGSIDQNALQNLSLIVNLSKNIQVNTSKSEEQQQDPEDLAEYFPSFCWVVRDFSLQLVSNNGQKITSRDYLERALTQQKGFTDDIEQKNRIRRLLCTFFKQRDCMTMVRPLVNEAQLQNLQKLQFDDLRSQFVQQVLYLRKKILTKITPKTFKGKQLDGEMYLHMLKSYIDAINDGAVPSIQTAWTYMCQQKCMKTQQECWKNFQQQIQLFLSNGFPISEQELNGQLIRLQKECLNKFNKQCVGEASQDYLQQLKNKVKHRIRQIQIENEKQSISVLKVYVVKNFQSIQKRVTSNQFENFQDYLKCINNFYQNLKQKGPNYPKRDLVFLEYTKKFIAQGAQRFMKNASLTYESAKALWQEMKSNLQNKVEDLKTQLSKQVKTRKEKVKQLDWENGQLIRNLQTCRSEINRMKQNEQRQKQANQIKIKQKVKEFDANKAQLLSQINQIKSLVSQLQSQKYKLQKQLQKTNAISDQKYRQLNQELQLSKQRDKENQIQLNKLRYQMNFKVQEITTQSQQKLKKSLDQHKKILNYVQDLQDQKKLLLENIASLQSEISIKTQGMSREIKTKNEEFLAYKQKTESQIQRLTKAYQNQINSQKQIREDLQKKQSLNCSKISQLHQKIRITSTQHQKQIAILNQSVSFMKISMQQAKETYEANIISYQAKVRQLEEMNKSIQGQNESQKVKQVQFQMREKFKALQTAYQIEKAKTMSEVQQIKKNKERLELDLKLLNNNMTNQSKNLKIIIEQLQNQLKSEIQKRQSIQKTYDIQMQQKLQKYETKIKELQNQIQIIKEGAEDQQRVGTMRSQQAVIQLKNYYEMEKQNLQKKLLKEREKYQKKLNQLQVTYQDQKNQRVQELQDQFSQRLDHLERKCMQDQEKINNLTYQSASSKKAYQQLQKKYSEQKENFQKKETDYLRKIQFLCTSLQTQKETSHSRVDDLKRQKNKLQKELLTFNYQKEEFTVIIKSKDQKIQKMKSQINIHSSILEKLNEENRNKITVATNQFIQKTINYEKDIALKQQQNQFMAKKIEEQQKSLQNFLFTHEQSNRILKEDYSMSVKSVQQKKNQEILLLEEKYDKLKKSYKENDLTLQKKVNLLQKQIAIQKQKTINLELRLKEYEEKITTDQNKFSNQINSTRIMLMNQKKEILQKYQGLKINLSQLQNEKQLILATYQREKVLLENKNAYLEESKEKNKKQLTENIKKLQENIENLQKLRISQKNSSENSLNQNLSKMQKKYWDQTKQMTQNYNKKQIEFEQTRKKLQAQIRSLTQKVAMQTQNKSEFSVTNQRRMKQLLQKQKKQSQQLQRLKSQKQQTAQQSYFLIQKQKQTYKAKLQEKQDKIRLLQKQKQQGMFQIEKDRLRTKMQRQHLENKLQESKEAAEKSKRQLQKMKKELDKYKSDRRNSRMTHNIGNLSRYSNLRPLEDSTLLNSSINSSSTTKDGKSSGFDESSMLDMSISSNYTLKQQNFSGFDQISTIKTNFQHSYIREGKSFSKAKDYRKDLIKNKQNLKILDDDQHDFFGQE